MVVEQSAAVNRASQRSHFWVYMLINSSFWTINISAGVENIVAQLVQLVEHLDELGVLRPDLSTLAANDNSDRLDVSGALGD